MCYSSDASILAFIQNIVCNIIIYQYQPIVALYFAYVGIMQLYDYIFWNNLKKNSINYITTKFAMITNLLQPLFLLFLITYIGKRKINSLSMFLVYIYVIFIIGYIVKYWNKIDFTLVEKSYPSLYWKWTYMPGCYILITLYLLLTFNLSLNYLVYPINILFTLMLAITYILSSVYYKNSNIGRFWCYFASYVPLIFIFFTPFSPLKL